MFIKMRCMFGFDIFYGDFVVQFLFKSYYKIFFSVDFEFNVFINFLKLYKFIVRIILMSLYMEFIFIIFVVWNNSYLYISVF